MKNIVLLFMFFVHPIFAQKSNNIPLTDDNHRLYNRLEILSGDMKNNHTVLKPISRNTLRTYIDSAVSNDYWKKK